MRIKNPWPFYPATRMYCVYQSDQAYRSLGRCVAGIIDPIRFELSPYLSIPLKTNWMGNYNLKLSLNDTFYYLKIVFTVIRKTA